MADKTSRFSRPEIEKDEISSLSDASAGAEIMSANSVFQAGRDQTSKTSLNEQIKAVGIEMAKATGIGSVGKSETFITANGEKLTGATFTNKLGTFLLVPGGEDGRGHKYKIETTESGEKTLVDLTGKPNREDFASLKEQANPLTQTLDFNSNIFIRQPDLSNALADQGGISSSLKATETSLKEENSGEPSDNLISGTLILDTSKTETVIKNFENANQITNTSPNLVGEFDETKGKDADKKLEPELIHADAEADAKKDDEKFPRRRYVIQPDDTLETIARKKLGDPTLALLIASINAAVLSSKLSPKSSLPVDLSIWLPSFSEIETSRQSVTTVTPAQAPPSAAEELTKRFGESFDGLTKEERTTSNLLGTERAAAISTQLAADKPASISSQLQNAQAKRRSNVEKVLGPLPSSKPDIFNYTVRLGDSLKSIATKHPALLDVKLWELLAAVNNITVPNNDHSLVKLTRGSTLRLPSAQEIVDYYALQSTKKNKNSGEIETKISTEGSSLGSGLESTEGSATGSATGSAKGSAKGSANELTSQVLQVEQTDLKPSEILTGPVVENVKDLADDCRVVRRHQAAEAGRIYQASLEVKIEGEWISITLYNISEGNCWRRSINSAGVAELFPLELPIPAIHQMLETDLSTNWQEYRRQFLAFKKIVLR
jgi:hypothetical protein